MRIQSVCLLLVLFSATVLSLDLDTKGRYEKFIKQHIDKHMIVNKCDAEIRKRKISWFNINTKRHECKQSNTFIMANIKTVKSVCDGEGEPYKNMTRSTEYFDIVFCNLTNQAAKYPKCHYDGKALKHRIIIKCEQGLPVHYHGDTQVILRID